MQLQRTNHDCSTLENPHCQKTSRNRPRSLNKLRIRRKVRDNTRLHAARISARALLAVIAAQLMLQATALPAIAQGDVPSTSTPTPLTRDTSQPDAVAAFTSLTALPWEASGREPMRIGSTVADKPCTLSSRVYDDCIGLSVSATLTITSAALSGYTRLTARIGLDDGVNDPAQCNLAGQPDQALTALVYIQADNVTLYESGALLRDPGNALNIRTRAVDIALPVGTKTLKIVVTGAPAGNAHCSMLDIVDGMLSGDPVQQTAVPSPTQASDAPAPKQTQTPTPRITRTPVPARRVLFLPIVFKPPSLMATPSPTPSPSPTVTPPVGQPGANGGDWPQLGHDAQRSNATSSQVDAPFCYAWKWNQVPFAARTQPVVASIGGGILYIGSMDGWMYARNAKTGAPVWAYRTDGPIRHSAGVLDGTVVFGSHDGWTYALDAANGALKWKTETGPSATAPLLDGRWAYVGSTSGVFTALDVANGTQKWQKSFGAPILTSPALSRDGKTVFFGTEDIVAIAVDAATGDRRWQQTLQGQSLAERYPVVAGNTVMYRSQPLYYFHQMLQGYGDDVMDQAGSVVADWDTDWQRVKPKIVDHLARHPEQRTFFALDATTGVTRGIAPMLYTYGLGEIPNMPVVRDDGVAYVTYRARHGIQTDSGTVHVSTKYDAEIGRMNLNTLDIAGVPGQKMSGYEWRMTSDEPSVLTLGGNMLFVDNWERGGGLNIQTGASAHLGGLGNPVGDCVEWCNPTTSPFFPLSGSGPSWPRPEIKGEGRGRAGIVIAADRVFWRAQGAGLAAFAHQTGGVCPAPMVYGPTGTDAFTGASTDAFTGASTPPSAREVADYVTLDLTTPVANPSADLVQRVQREVRDIVTSGGHLMPFYLERGFSTSMVWPAGSPKTAKDVPQIAHQSHGNAYWFDPGELLYTLALAYPYLDSSLQQQTRSYVQAEMARFSPLKNLPYGDKNADWLRSGVARERYSVTFRKDISGWPVPSVSPAVFYAVWLWSKNTGDWSYACGESATLRSLYDSMKGNAATPRYYADIAGLIGYARLSKALTENKCGGWNATDVAENVRVAEMALQAGKNWSDFRIRASVDFRDPLDIASGFSLPALFGMTPEIGLFLAEQTGSAVTDEIAAKQSNVGVPWWYLTRAGEQGNLWETTFLAPQTAWSHFLARAYVSRTDQATLRKWLDIPWARGDLYSLQKVVATIQAGR